MSKLQTMEKVVLKVLEEYPEARKDDYVLMVKVCYETGVKADHINFAEGLLFHKLYNIPNWKTVERCRRKIQKQRPDLVVKTTAEKRQEEEKEYEKYSRT